MTREPLGTIGILATGATGVAGLVTLFLRVAVVPVWERMFQDFGGELPVLTRLVLGWGWPFAWAGLLIAMAALAALPLLPRRLRLALAFGGVLLGALELAATIVAVYLPIFALADIQP